MFCSLLDHHFLFMDCIATDFFEGGKEDLFKYFQESCVNKLECKVHSFLDMFLLPVLCW